MARKIKEATVSNEEEILETNATDAPVKDIAWKKSDVATESDTKLEEDKGEGDVALIRLFEFAANPEAFKLKTPSKQELFNSHIKGIEALLWRDGLKLMLEVPPRLTINKKKTKYRIFVGAKPAKGHLLMERPQTLKEIVHGTT